MGSKSHFTLGEIAEAAGGQILFGDADTTITNISVDTRKLSGNNTLFVALHGENWDGHVFLDHAQSAGARAVLVDNISNVPIGLPVVRVGDTLKAYGDLARALRRRFQIPVIAITGSYGKTTTRALTAQALSAGLSPLSSEGNFNNEIGVPQTLMNLDTSHEAIVLELAMRGRGHIKYLTDISLPNIGVITNIGPQHIGLLGSLDNIATAKGELLTALPPDGVAVLPADDRYIDFLRSIATCRVITFGRGDADYRITAVKPDDSGQVLFSLATRSQQRLSEITLPLGGKFNALNAAAALAVAGELGLDIEKAARALQNAKIPNGRMRRIENKPHSVTIIEDCYNAGPYSTRAALESLLDYPPARRKVAVLGEMAELGQWSEMEHRKIGSLASRYVDIVIGVGHHARWIIEELRGLVRSRWCPDSETAATCARAIIRSGDVVLVKGSRRVRMEKVVESLVNW